MAVQHKFQSAKGDGGDASLVRPSNWNDDHDHVPFHVPIMFEGSALQPWSNLGAGPTELVAPKMRTAADLTHATAARVVIAQGVVGVTGRCRIEYSTDQATWLQLGDTGQVDVAFGTTANKVYVGAWQTLATGAKGDVFLRAVGVGGNGTEDPSVWSIELQVR
jgi:hypothetical protein